MTTPAEPAAEASADRGWRIEPLPPDLLPPEVLELFPEGTLKVLGEFALRAPMRHSFGTIQLLVRELPAHGQPVVVVLREGREPQLVDPFEEGGVLTFRWEAGAHDDAARLVLLAVRDA